MTVVNVIFFEVNTSGTLPNGEIFTFKDIWAIQPSLDDM